MAKEQIPDLFKNIGKNIEDELMKEIEKEISDEIDRILEIQKAVIVCIMNKKPLKRTVLKKYYKENKEHLNDILKWLNDNGYCNKSAEEIDKGLTKYITIKRANNKILYG